MDNVDFSVNDGQPVHLRIDGGNCVDLNIGGEIYGVETPPYEGAYEATPTQSTQLFATEGKRMLHDFTVNPIPHNYGLITYNGSTIMVS